MLRNALIRVYYLVMATRMTTLSYETIELIKSTVRESMLPFGFRSVDVRVGEDHDGDEVIFVEAEYDLTDTPVDSAVTGALTTKLRDRLWERGETRFPHIRHKFHERQPLKSRGRRRA